MDFEGDAGAAGSSSGSSFDDVFGGGAGADSGAAAASGDQGAGADSGAAAASGDQGAGADSGAAAGSEQGGADPDWYGSLSPELTDGETASNRDWIKAKGFKDLDGVTKALRNAEKAIHDSGRIKVPGEGASEAEVKAFHKAIGVPDDAAGYGTPELKGADGQPLTDANGDPVALDQGVMDRLAGAALKGGVSQAGFDAIVNDYVQLQLEQLGMANSEQQRAAAAKIKEWGSDAPANRAAVEKGLAALGVSGVEAVALRQALGAGRAMDIFAKLGKGIAEDTMLHGDSGGKRFGISGAQAESELKIMKADPKISDKIMVPGSAENVRYNYLIEVQAAEEERRRQQG